MLVGLDSWPPYPSTTYLYLYGLCTLSLSLNTCMFDKKIYKYQFPCILWLPYCKPAKLTPTSAMVLVSPQATWHAIRHHHNRIFFCEEFHHHNRVNCVVEQNRRKRLKSSHQMLINCIP